MLSKNVEKSVNDLLHKARGERFRQNQNIQKNKTRHHAHLPTKSLPPHLLTSSDSDDRESNTVSNVVLNTAGPVPRSWRTDLKEVQDKESPEWRSSALSLVLDELGVDHAPVPSLSDLCMKVLLDEFSELEDFEQTLLPLLPLHLKYILQRYAAVHTPLSTPKLRALVGESGHINGEFIVVGPGASLRRDEISLKPSVDNSQDWEAEDPFVDSFEFRTLALVSIDLPLQTLLSLPRSLTRIALIDVSTVPPISRLPTLCPLIVVLDLSFNSWLKDTNRSHSILGMVNWDKWNDLDVLGLRGCSVREDTLDRVNQHRWVDVRIILG